MKKYDSYKDSGIEWIGEIPEHWEVKKGKRFIPLKNGFPFDSSKFSPFSDSGLPLVRIRDIESNAPQTFYKGEVVEDAIIDNGDILIGMDGDFNIAIWNGGKALLNQRVCKVEKDEKFDGKFLFYLFPKYLKVINDLTYYTTVKHLSNNDLWKVKYPLPPKSEQTAIANYLDRKTAEIDELIADKKRLLELYEEEKTAIINQAVTKGINPDTPMKDSGIEWLGEIPEHWEVKRLKYLLSQKLMYGANESAEEENRDNPRYIRITDFGNDGKLKAETFKSLPPEKANDYLLTEGDVLFARSGATVGKTFQFKNYKGLACFAGYLIKATPNPTLMDSDFLYFYTKSGAYENWKTSIFNQATIQNIGADKYAFLEISTPPNIEEQKTIVHHIETECARIDAKKSKTEKLIELLTEYRTALISEVVTGKIKVID